MARLSSILFLHEIVRRVLLIALKDDHLRELTQLVARLHVIDEVHQKLNAVLLFHKLAVLVGINLKESKLR